MNKRGIRILEIISLIVIFSLLSGYPIYFFIINKSPDVKHDTDRWILFWDREDNKISLDIENSSMFEEIKENWKEIQKSKEPELEMAFYGEIISYDNSWNFRFNSSDMRVFISPTGSTIKSSAPIEFISDHLEHYLNQHYGIHITAMRFNNSKYTGISSLSIDIGVIGVMLILFGLHFYFKREKELAIKIREMLTCYKDIPKGISITQISKNIGLKQNRIEQLMNKNNLIDDLGLHVTDGQIQFKDLIYSQSISQIEVELPSILKLPINQLTIDHYSLLHQSKKNLEEALAYFSKESINIGKQTQINTTLELITELLESITLDAINK